jgi:hypothetical protein
MTTRTSIHTMTPCSSFIMKRLSRIAATLLVSALGLLGCANMSTGPSGTGWGTLLNGQRKADFYIY